MVEETLIPKIGVVTDIRKDTPDVKTFRVVGTDGKKLLNPYNMVDRLGYDPYTRNDNKNAAMYDVAKLLG